MEDGGKMSGVGTARRSWPPWPWGSLLLGLAHVLLALLLVLVFYMFLVRSSPAHDGVHDQWYDSLKRPDGAHCCGGDDCKETDAELRDDAWWARDPSGVWQRVPSDHVITNRGNPVGPPILCARWAHDSWRVVCFVPGALT